jgi:chemotaxis protein MotB
MSRRRKPPGHTNHERWLVSYADFITLLFAFFVVLYASSQVDHRKAGKLAMAIQAAFQEMGVFQNSVTRVPNLEDAIPFGTLPTVIASRPDGPLEGEGESNNLAQLQHELEIILAAEIARKEDLDGARARRISDQLARGRILRERIGTNEAVLGTCL